MRIVLVFLIALWPCATRAADAASAGPTTRADTLATPARPAYSFDVIPRESYLRRHAFSLDNFLEMQPQGLVARLGPIGNEAFYSRWGLGRGRALVFANGIPMNDPQDGTAPIAHIATSGIGSLSMDASGAPAFAPGIEGSLSLRDMEAPPDRPHTFIELTKANNELRQRRVRFASEAGRVGLDISYDEVLDDGYDFDAADVVPITGQGGASNSRNASIAVRGQMTDGAGYTAGLRRFRSSATGDLESALNEGTKSGHITWAGVNLGAAEAVVYGRGYRTSRPDSSTSNESVGASVTWNLHRGASTLRMFARGEHTDATQDVVGASTHDKMTNGSAGASTEVRHGGLEWFAHGAVGADESVVAWSGGGGVRRRLPLGEVALSADRSFRLPTMGERFLPGHVRDGLVLSGNENVDAETALEGSADWTIRRAGVSNRVRASWMRSQDAISFAPVAGDSLARRATNSTDEPVMGFFEERVGVHTGIGAVDVYADAGGRVTSGDRSGLFLPVPRAQVNASLMCGMQLFDRTSALYVGGEYTYLSDRHDYNGVSLSDCNVVNLSLVGRLIDAHFYLRWLNVLDEKYETVSGYLMTPRSLAYGIEWTLFD